MTPWLLVALLQAAGAPASAPEGADRDVVVTAQPLGDLRRQLDECLARHCPPREDIDRSLAFAEGQFVAGDYKGSRETLLAARKRNAKYAASLPVEVSELHRANARLAGLNGLSDAARTGTFDIVDSLKAGLDREDARVLLARLEVGDAFATEGRMDDALERYDLVIRQARRLNLRTVEGMAMFREATLMSVAASLSSVWKGRAEHAVKDIEGTTDPVMAPFRNGARLIALHLASPKDQAAQADRVLAALEPVETDRPILAFSPPIEPDAMIFGAMGVDETQWADVGFTVTADGRVTDIHMLRTSAQMSERLLKLALQSLQRRRYMPAKLPTGSDGFSRIERFSFVSDRVTRTGSRMASRSNRARLSVVDLTPAPQPRVAGS